MLSKSIPAHRWALLSTLFMSACGGGGNGRTNQPPAPPPPPGTYSAAVVDGYSVDVYRPDSATRAVVFLHGGGGVNYRFAYNLGINLADAHPSSANTNWNWLNQHGVIAVFPQGVGSTTTWRNWVMESGRDDVTFLQHVASYIRSTLGVQTVYVFGHSNGGMMVNRLWCESPATFNAYISASGAASTHYANGACSSAEMPHPPYLSIVGGADTTIGIQGNWSNPVWTIDPLYVGKNPGAFLTPTTLINEWNQYGYRAALQGCGPQAQTDTSLDDGVVRAWSNCNGRLQLVEVLASTHEVDALDTALATEPAGNATSHPASLLDYLATFIDGPGK
jgi:poly(3-hydroxybutyrate) depolymerase